MAAAQRGGPDQLERAVHVADLLLLIDDLGAGGQAERLPRQAGGLVLVHARVAVDLGAAVEAEGRADHARRAAVLTHGELEVRAVDRHAAGGLHQIDVAQRAARRRGRLGVAADSELLRVERADLIDQVLLDGGEQQAVIGGGAERRGQRRLVQTSALNQTVVRFASTFDWVADRSRTRDPASRQLPGTWPEQPRERCAPSSLPPFESAEPFRFRRHLIVAVDVAAGRAASEVPLVNSGTSHLSAHRLIPHSRCSSSIGRSDGDAAHRHETREARNSASSFDRDSICFDRVARVDAASHRGVVACAADSAQLGLSLPITGAQEIAPQSPPCKRCSLPVCLERMCRNIKTLHNFKPPATHEEIEAAALQFVRKVSGYQRVPQVNADRFARAVAEITRADRAPAR